MKYVVYEFERVIYRGNLARDFYFFCIQENKKLIKYLLFHMMDHIFFLHGKISEKTYYEKYFSFLKETQNASLLVEKFWHTHRRKLDQNILSILNKNTYVISALPLEFIEPVLKEYHVTHIKGTEFSFEQAKLTGEIFVSEYRKSVLEKEFRKKEIDQFYGFRTSDVWLFEQANHAYIAKNRFQLCPYTKKRLESKKFQYFKMTLILCILIGWILSINFAFSMKNNDIAAFQHYFDQPIIVLLNGMPLLLLLAFLYICTNRLWISFGITNFVILVMGFINRTKLIYRDDPFVFLDTTLASESMEMAKKYDLNINLFLISLIIISLLMMAVLFVYQRKHKMPLKKRIVMGLGIVLVSIVGVKTIYQSDSIFYSVGDDSTINRWSYTQQCQVRGFIFSFLHSTKVAGVQKPDHYSDENVEKILKKYQKSNIPEYENGKKINVISIMLEAYQDFSSFDSVEFEKDIYETFHRIENQSYSGKLISNVFGGGTIDTERSYLTGFHDFPTFHSKTNSFVHYFNEQGYRTEAMHPIYGWFYNRRNVNEKLGFQNFDYYENRFSFIQSEYLSDTDFFDYIIEGYQNSKKKKTPYFHFSVTYQNHGPYATEKQYDEAILKRKENMTDDVYHMVNNYLSGVEKTNQAIEKLVDYFEKEKEPVVILIFSDHNPYLGEDNIGYSQMGIEMEVSSENGMINYYGVPYLIWGNDTAKETLEKDLKGTAPTISPMYLMPELFETLGWKGNEYLQYLTKLKQNLPVIHDPWYKETSYATKLSQKGKNELEEFFNIQYYWLNHDQEKNQKSRK